MPSPEILDASSAIKDGENYITDIVIPYEVEKNGVKYKVTEIGEAAFGLKEFYFYWYQGGGNFGTYFPNNKTYTSFILPNTIEKIGSYAFSIIQNVNSIKIPISVTTMGKRIFFLAYGEELEVYCEATSKPSGWDENWSEYHNSYNNVGIQTINVHWGS